MQRKFETTTERVNCSGNFLQISHQVEALASIFKLDLISNIAESRRPQVVPTLEVSKSCLPSLASPTWTQQPPQSSRASLPDLSFALNASYQKPRCLLQGHSVNYFVIEIRLRTHNVSQPKPTTANETAKHCTH